MLVVSACAKLLIVIPLCIDTPQFINIHCFRVTLPVVSFVDVTKQC
jgi:hypothetical protein